MSTSQKKQNTLNAYAHRKAAGTSWELTETSSPKPLVASVTPLLLVQLTAVPEANYLHPGHLGTYSFFQKDSDLKYIYILFN